MLVLLCEKIERDTRFSLDHIRDGWPVTERHNPPERLSEARLLEMLGEAEKQNRPAFLEVYRKAAGRHRDMVDGFVNNVAWQSFLSPFLDPEP